MSALSRLPDVSDLPIIDATAYFDRRWGLERTAKEVRKRCKFRGPVRIVIPPRRPGGAYREIRYDGRKYYQLEMSVWDPCARKARAKALPKAKAPRRKARGASFLWRDWPPQLR